MRRALQIVCVLMVLALALSACKTTGGSGVKRVASDSVTDLSGRWNDTDSQQVASVIITKSLESPWLEEWRGAHDNQRPVVIVGTILNKSQEHISVSTFVKDIQAALINSGKVRFVANKTERQDLRGEREDQQKGFTAEESQAALGNETGANFMLKGSIEAVVDEAGGKRAVWYQINLELHDLTSNEIAWMGQHKIKKLVSHASVQW